MTDHPTTLPGNPLTSGFTLRVSNNTQLSPEARKRVAAKIAAVEHARRIALAASHTYVIGGSA